MKIIRKKSKASLWQHILWTCQPESKSQRLTLQDWQERVLNSILLAGLILGFLAYLPSVWLSFKEGLYWVAIIDSLVYGFICTLVFSRRLSYYFRAVSLCIICYLVAMLLLIVLGPFGAGPIWLFAFPVMAAVLLGPRGAVVSLAINAATLGAVGFLVAWGYTGWTYPTTNPFEKWIVISFNFMLLNTVATISLTAILKGLQTTLELERELSESLQIQHLQLEDANERLVQEIATKERVARELSETDFRLHVLAENSLDFIWQMDEKGRFTFVNPAVKTLFGFSAEEWNGTTLSDHCKAEDATNIPDFSRGLTGGEFSATEFLFETSIRHKNGEDIPVEILCKPLFDANDNVMGVQGTARDIRERKLSEARQGQLEEQLHQSQKMEAIGQLAGGIAHDFNNLLTAIIGNANFALRAYPDDSELCQDLEEIESAAKRAANLTRQLLAFSRKQVIQPEILNLNHTIESIDKLLKRLIREDIDIQVKPASDLDMVLADPGQMEQVIINLVVNARDAMPDGGRIILETANVELHEDYARDHLDVKSGQYVMLAVSDNGKGMSEEVRRQIFEPFFTTKAEGEGTGMGLATVYGITKKHGGTIWVYSEEGHGTTFKIYLPSTEAKDERQDQPREEELTLHGSETILVVEDEEDVRSMLMRTLADLGYEVLEAPNGSQALEMMNKLDTPPELLLTDVIMPEMGGKVLAEKLKHQDSKVKVLFISGYTDNAIEKDGILEPDVDLLQKPFTPAILAKKVRKVLDKPN